MKWIIRFRNTVRFFSISIVLVHLIVCSLFCHYILLILKPFSAQTLYTRLAAGSSNCSAFKYAEQRGGVRWDRLRRLASVRTIRNGVLLYNWLYLLCAVRDYIGLREASEWNQCMLFYPLAEFVYWWHPLIALLGNAFIASTKFAIKRDSCCPRIYGNNDVFFLLSSLEVRSSFFA